MNKLCSSSTEYREHLKTKPGVEQQRYMGVTTCDIHGHIGIGEACRHIITNIDQGINEKCVLMRVKVLPGVNTSDIEKAGGPFTAYIPFCLSCYESKKMSEQMKIVDNADNLIMALADYEIGYGCQLCIEGYAARHKIN